jgi:tetratricopeptide (TPR) repeat protein
MVAKLALSLALMVSLRIASARPSPEQSSMVPAPESSQDQQAKAEYIAGQADYNEGSYELAIARFDKSYQLTARPELLFNIANCYERLAQYGEAANALARYIDDAPVDEHTALRKRVARLRERAQSQLAKQEQSAKQIQMMQNKLAATQVAPAPYMNNRKWGAVASGAVGFVALAVGLVELTTAAQGKSRAQDQCRNGFCPTSTRSEFDLAARRNLYGGIALGVSALGFGSGTYLWLTSHRAKHEEGSHAIALGLGFRHQF